MIGMFGYGGNGGLAKGRDLGEAKYVQSALMDSWPPIDEDASDLYFEGVLKSGLGNARNRHFGYDVAAGDIRPCASRFRSAFGDFDPVDP